MHDVQKELERFRSIIAKDWGRTESEGRPVAAVTRLSAVAIACRHFAMPNRARPDLPATEILRIASEVTGYPMETMTDASGAKVQVWRPVRGEVGWLPYDVPPQNWTGGKWEWNSFANRWVQPGAKSGPAITTVPVGA